LNAEIDLACTADVVEGRASNSGTTSRVPTISGARRVEGYTATRKARQGRACLPRRCVLQPDCWASRSGAARS